jgi:superfamily II DNA or RNA helicase
MNLRPYQNEFVHAVALGFSKGFMRQLGVLPVGGGKTICFSHIARRFLEKRGERTLILAHRNELVQQAADKLERSTGIIAAIEKADIRASRDAEVVVGSVQTLQRKRLASWPADHFGLIVCDEAHHIVSKQWQDTLGHFNARVLGVTATPDRADKKSLSRYFDNLAYEVGLLDLISQKYLAPITIRSVPLEIDIREVRQVAGDLDSAGLDSAITPYLGAIARYITEECGDRRRILTFLPLIQTSHAFVAECRKYGINATHVDGTSPDRKEILESFSRGEIRLLSNAMLLTEGYDEPAIDCVLVLRPTKSRGLFAQMIGRGTRLAEGKKDMLFLDFLWLHERHDLAKPASLIAKDKAEEESITKAIKDGATDLEQASKDATAERESALIQEIAKKARRKAVVLDIRDVGRIFSSEPIQNYKPQAPWESSRPSPKQEQILSRYGIRCETKGEASMVMNHLFDRSRAKLATPKQLIWLKRMNIPDAEKITAKEATQILNLKWNNEMQPL